jgi:Mn2+/Fe2+ NRAMP family transporter
MFVPYNRYAAILKWLTLVLLAYVALVFMVKVEWTKAFHDLVIPHIYNRQAITTVVAILGTTISPFLFFWQAAQEVEEIDQVEERKPLHRARHQAQDAFTRTRHPSLISPTGLAIKRSWANCGRPILSSAKHNLPLGPLDPATLFGGGEQGYTDYTALQEA